MRDIRVSLILPCYNEESILENTLKIVSEFSKQNKDYEFIFVNDGSTDNTINILNEFSRLNSNQNIRIVSYYPNKGKGYAIRKGVEIAVGDNICFTDSDLAYSLDHVIALVDKLKDYEIVIGCRNLSNENEEKTSILRFIVSRGYNILSRVIFGFSKFDTQAGIKGFRNRVAKHLFSKQKLDNYSFDVEILYLSKKKGYILGMIPANLSKSHKEKKSKVNVIRDSINMFLDLIRIKSNNFFGKYG